MSGLCAAAAAASPPHPFPDANAVPPVPAAPAPVTLHLAGAISWSLTGEVSLFHFFLIIYLDQASQASLVVSLINQCERSRLSQHCHTHHPLPRGSWRTVTTVVDSGVYWEE